MDTAPVVIAGMKSPEGFQERKRLTPPPLSPAAAPPAEGEVLFIAIARDYVLQLETVGPRMTGSGEYLQGFARKAKFSDHEYRTSEASVIGELKKAKGYGVEFWDYAEAKAATDAAQLEQLTAHVMANPELKAKLIEELRGGGELPPSATPEGQPAAPAPQLETQPGQTRIVPRPIPNASPRKQAESAPEGETSS